MNGIKEINIKNRTYYFFNDIINVKSLDPNKIKIDENSYKNILKYYIGYVAPSNVKPLHLITNNIYGYI